MTDLTQHERADLKSIAEGRQPTHGMGHALQDKGLAVFLPFSGWQLTYAGELWLETEDQNYNA